jgi:ATP-dependent RNA helicase DeaD
MASGLRSRYIGRLRNGTHANPQTVLKDMASFEDFGLREPLLRALEDGGFEQPTALQEALVPVLRREGNVVARAASGSGKTLAYALGVLDRLEAREAGEGEAEEEAGGTRVLVLVPAAEAAERAALSLVPFAQAVDLSVAIPGAWGIALAEADVVVATPGDALRAVRGSEVKLDSLEAVVVDGASLAEAMGEWEALETLFDHVPRNAQRVVLTPETTPAVDDLVDRRVKRALRYPPQAALADQAQQPEARGVVGYVVVSEREKVDVLARLLGGGAPPVVLCRTDERAAELAEALAVRGFAVGDVGDEEADVAVPSAGTTLEDVRDEAEGEAPMVVSYDVPPDERTLLARHAGDEAGFVLVEPRELTHLHDVARRAGIDARPAGVTGEDAAAAGALRAFRGEVRRALREEDLGAQILVLEPLFEEHTAAEVAAALAALLRRRAPAAPAAAPVEAAPARRAPSVSATHPGEAPGPAPSVFTRLFVSIGERDGVRAGDLVGAIAGEAEIPGKSIGKVDVRDTFSIVEVTADAADRVIRAVNGTTIKGRSVRVDYDRGATRGARRPDAGAPRGPGGPRGPGAPRGAAGGTRRPGPGGAPRRPGPRGGDDRPPRRPPSRG